MEPYFNVLRIALFALNVFAPSQLYLLVFVLSAVPHFFVLGFYAFSTA